MQSFQLLSLCTKSLHRMNERMANSNLKRILLSSSKSASSLLILNSNSIKVYDPENLTIVSCSQADWDLVTSLAEQPVARLGDFVTFFQGEVNQTVATSRGLLTESGRGPLVTRGANISMYQLREASQGEDIYLDVAAFLEGKSRETKAFHHTFERVGLQESSPQNNFRRIIACRIPSGKFCNHKINYTTSKHAKLPLELILFILNSSFADWYFRLGSTNAAVSHYQLTNIPCPSFSPQAEGAEAKLTKDIKRLLETRHLADVEAECVNLAKREGGWAVLVQAIVAIVRFIEREEQQRGLIVRSQRSHLAEDAEKCQVILDKLMLILLGIGDQNHEFIRNRLSQML